VTPRRLALAHFLLAALLFAACLTFACVTDEQRRTAELVERYRPVLEDAGRKPELWRLNGLEVRVHPLSDGGSWPIPPMPIALADGGLIYLTELFDYAGQACVSFKGERVLWVASLSSPYVCHGFGHVTHADVLGSDGGCLDPGGHPWMASVGFDRKCREVTAP
jgi:hypothetical protein